jgi:hypothetical protein
MDVGLRRLFTGLLMRQGHPRRRWEDVLQEYFVHSFGHNHWMNHAQDRTWWHEQEAAFVDFG